MELFFSGATSLKDKRRALKSIMERVKAHFNVSVAEIDKQDTWQLSVVGIAFISNESHHVCQTLSAIARYIEGMGKAEVVNVRKELF